MSLWSTIKSALPQLTFPKNPTKKYNSTENPDTIKTQMISKDAAPNADGSAVKDPQDAANSPIAATLSNSIESLPTSDGENLDSKPADNDVVMDDASVATAQPVCNFAVKAGLAKGDSPKNYDVRAQKEATGGTPSLEHARQTIPKQRNQVAEEPNPVADDLPAAEKSGGQKLKNVSRSSSQPNPVVKSGIHKKKMTLKASPDEAAALRKLRPFNSPPVKKKHARRQQPNNNNNSITRRRSSSKDPEEGSGTRKRTRSEDSEDRKKYPFRRASLVTYEAESSEDEFEATKAQKKTPGRPSSKDSKRKRQKRTSTTPKQSTSCSDGGHIELTEEEQLHIKRAMKRGSTPGPNSPGYKAWKDWKALRRPSLTTTLQRQHVPSFVPTPPTPHSLFSPTAERNLQTLYHLLRSHLARGNIWAAFESCHSMLKSAYEKAEVKLPVLWQGDRDKSGKKSPKDFGYPVEVQMQELREKIAGIWCLYSHVFLQIAETDKFLSCSDNRFEGASRGLASLNEMEDCLWDHAIAILAACASCPFVGNHAAITLALSRLRLRQRQRGILRPYPNGPRDAQVQYPQKTKGTSVYHDRSGSSKAHWENNVEHALKICQAGIERAAPTSEIVTRRCYPQKVSCYEKVGEEVYLDTRATTERVAQIVSNIMWGSSRGSQENSEGIAFADPACHPNWFVNVLDLPRRLEGALLNDRGQKDVSSGLPYLFVDRPSTRSLLMETNCLSRLVESLNACSSDENVQLVCDPERLKRDPEKPEREFKQVPCVDGVVWDDCLHFQSLTGVFVEQSTAKDFWFVQEHRLSCTANFFRAGSYHASPSIDPDEEIDGFARFPSDPVYSYVSFPCPKCSSLHDSQRDVQHHAAQCTMSCSRRFRQDALHSAWDDLSSKRAGCAVAASTPSENGEKYFDLECVCKECCSHDQLYKDINNLGGGRCWKHGALEAAENILEDDCKDEAAEDDDKDEAAAFEEDSKQVAIVDLASNEESNAMQQVIVDVASNEESNAVRDVIVDVASNEESNAMPSLPLKASESSESDAVLDGMKPQNGKEDAEVCLKTKKVEKRPAGMGKKKSSEKKRSIYANLAGLFDDEAAGEEKVGSDDEGEVVVPPAMGKDGAVPPVERANDLIPAVETIDNVVPAIEADESFEDVDEVTLPSKACTAVATPNNDNFQVEYPCRTCRQRSYSSEEARDAHEKRCKGVSAGCSVLVLEEQWPCFSNRNNKNSPLRKPRGGFPKPSAEGPTPGKCGELPKPSAEDATPGERGEVVDTALNTIETNSGANDGSPNGVTKAKSKNANPANERITRRSASASKRTTRRSNGARPHRNGFLSAGDGKRLSKPLSRKKSTLVVN